MRTLIETLLALSLPLASLLAPSPLGAQPTGERPPLFGEKIDVRVVNVEVVVTDKDGQPVFGLRPEDFRLVVDGKQVPVDYFTEVQGGVAVERPGGGAGAGGPAGLPELAPGQPVPTSYLVFIDDFFSIARDRNRVLERLRDQIPLLAPGDRMAVVAYDGRIPEMLTSWTGSTTALRKVFEKAIGRPAYGLSRVAELRNLETSRRLGSYRVSRYGLTVDEEFYTDRLANQVDRSVRAAAATLRSFAKPPGRKVMLLLSGGWPYDLATYAANSLGRPLLDRRYPDGDELLGPLTQTANLLGYTLYPVDVPGMSSGTTDASGSGPPDAGALSVRELEVHDALTFVATETGGRALVNSNRLEAFERAVADTRSYYWLGFTSDRHGDGVRHDIRVSVERPGLEVRTRDSFRDLSRKTEVNLAVESALLFGNAPGFDNLPLELAELARDGRKYMKAKVSIAIPANALTLVQQGDAWVGEVELRVAAVDEDGNQSEVPVISARLKLGEKPEAGALIPYSWSIRLRREKQRLVVAVYDTLSGAVFSNSVDIEPPRS